MIIAIIEMKKLFSYLLLLVFLSAAGCAKKNASAYYSNGVKPDSVYTVEVHTLNDSSIWCFPLQMECTDSLLVILDYMDDCYFHVYTLSGNPKGKFARKGQGPGELLFSVGSGWELAMDTTLCIYEPVYGLAEGTVPAFVVGNEKTQLGFEDAYAGNEFIYALLHEKGDAMEPESVIVFDWQGNAVVNYTSHEYPFTRIIEHKHFLKEESPVSWISREYPVSYEETGEPYYPVSDERNTELYKKYRTLSECDKHLIIGGRLAEYRYYDMDKSIEAALDCYQRCR